MIEEGLYRLKRKYRVGDLQYINITEVYYMGGDEFVVEGEILDKNFKWLYPMFKYSRKTAITDTFQKPLKQIKRFIGKKILSYGL